MVIAGTTLHVIDHWGDQEMGTAISCTECSQMTDLIQKLIETLWQRSHTGVRCIKRKMSDCVFHQDAAETRCQVVVKHHVLILANMLRP